MPPALPQLALRNAAITFGGKPLFSGIDVTLGRGERVCLVGANGSGKSTILKALAGEIELDKGERFLQPGLTVGYLPQNADLSVGGIGRRLCRRRRARHGRRPLSRRLGAGPREAGGQPRAFDAVRRRRAARGAGAHLGEPARSAAAGRADQPPRPADHRVAGRGAGELRRRHPDDQPRPRLPAQADQPPAVAGPRPHVRARRRLRRASSSGPRRSSTRRRPSSAAWRSASRPRNTGCSAASPRAARATKAGAGACSRCARRRPPA